MERSSADKLSISYPGALAQLGERIAGSDEVRGSIPLGSIIKNAITLLRWRFFCGEINQNMHNLIRIFGLGDELGDEYSSCPKKCSLKTRRPFRLDIVQSVGSAFFCIRFHLARYSTNLTKIVATSARVAVALGAKKLSVLPNTMPMPCSA